MENEQHRYALRSGSRSRSQTPSVQQARVTMETDSSEHHYDLRSRSRERSRTPGDLMALRKPSSRPSPSSLAKLPEQSIQVITATKEESVITKNESESDKSQDGTPLSRKTERYSTRQKSRKQMVANGQSDSQAREKAEIKRKSTSARRVITSDYSSEEGEREDPPSRPNSARDIYKQAGDWWNVFPKTDYTYSRASQCRYEIAPGILAMPNMSRRSLHSDGDSAIASEMSVSNQQNIAGGADDVDSNLLEETSLRERRMEQHRHTREFSYNECASSERERQRRSDAAMPFQIHRLDAGTYIDSDAELEDTVSSPSELAPRRTWRIGWLFTNLAAITVTWLRRLFGFLQVERRAGRSRASYQYEKYYESIWSRLWGKVDGCAQYLYFFVVQIFLFDSWLLSRICSSRHQFQERGSKFTWILLLTPLLLLLGSWGLPYIVAHSGAEALIGSLARAAQWISSSFADLESRKILNNRLDLPLEDDHRKALTEILNDLQSRMTDLELSSLEGTERLTDLTRSHQVMIAQNQNQTTDTMAAGGMSEPNYSFAKIHDLAAIRLELESLKEQWADLKACCNSRLKQSDGKHPVPGENIVAAVVPDGPNDEASAKLHLMKIVKNLLSFSKPEDVAMRNAKPTDDQISSALADSRVREIVREMLRVYDADKTGRVDYALESAGGLVISTRCTQRYDLKQVAIKILSFTLYYENNNPRTVIQGNPIQPGTCWAFQGFPGYLLIKLRSFVRVTGFTLEHAPKSILPNEEMKSAPRKFNVWGFTGEIDPDPVLFGDYEFLDTDESLQYFPLQNAAITKPYQYVELRVHSNHGQLEYTCLYRFRVHGKPV